MYTLVVSKYNENTAWTEGIVAAGNKVIIYDKANPKAENPLPNYGRHTDTILYHIIARYYQHYGVTVFCQGNPFDHHPGFLKALDGIEDDENIFQWAGDSVLSADQSGKPHHDGLPLLEVWGDIFNVPCPEKFIFAPGEHFAVGAVKIRSKPVEYYMRIRALQNKYAKKWDFSIERLWGYIFQ